MEGLTVSKRIFFLSTQKNDLMFQSNYMASFKPKLFWGYPSKQENTHPQNVLATAIYVQGLNNLGDDYKTSVNYIFKKPLKSIWVK